MLSYLANEFIEQPIFNDVYTEEEKPQQKHRTKTKLPLSDNIGKENINQLMLN
jgi:hypothetical protein